MRNAERIVVRAAVMDAIVAHAEAARPDECCGILVGTAGRIDQAIPGRNIAEQPSRRYLLDPQDHVDAVREARRRGLEVLGFYHSHPHSAPQPSETDRLEAAYPDHLYLIVGLAAAAPDIRLFELVSGNFAEVSFVTVR
jgi:proteasome lid subunit RPN8/RPN11